MIQTITVPEQTLEHIVSEIRMNILNKDNVRGIVVIARRPVGSTATPQFLPTGVNVTDILTEEVQAANLTAGDITGFKKCIKAICAKGMNIAFTEATEAL